MSASRWRRSAGGTAANYRGFFSKDEILAGAMANGHINLMVAGLVGAFMTSLYTFRMIFIVFHGKEQIRPLMQGRDYSPPAADCAAGPVHLRWRDDCAAAAGVLPDTTELEHGRVLTLEITSGVVAIAGILIAAWLWLGKRTLVTAVANSAPGRLLGTWWYNAWGFDWLYDMIFTLSRSRACVAVEARPAEQPDEYPGDPLRFG